MNYIRKIIISILVCLLSISILVTLNLIGGKSALGAKKEEKPYKEIIFTTTDLKQDYEIVGLIMERKWGSVNRVNEQQLLVEVTQKCKWRIREAGLEDVVDAIIGVRMSLDESEGTIYVGLYGTAVKFK